MTLFLSYPIRLGCEFQNLPLRNKRSLLAGEETLPELIASTLDTLERHQVEQRPWSLDTPGVFRKAAHVHLWLQEPSNPPPSPPTWVDDQLPNALTHVQKVPEGRSDERWSLSLNSSGRPGRFSESPSFSPLSLPFPPPPSLGGFPLFTLQLLKLIRCQTQGMIPPRAGEEAKKKPQV